MGSFSIFNLKQKRAETEDATAKIQSMLKRSGQLLEELEKIENESSQCITSNNENSEAIIRRCLDGIINEIEKQEHRKRSHIECYNRKRAGRITQ